MCKLEDILLSIVRNYYKPTNRGELWQLSDAEKNSLLSISKEQKVFEIIASELCIKDAAFERLKNIRNYSMTLENAIPIFKEFEMHSIKYAVIKGITCANDSYKDISYRSCVDIDVLVSPEALDTVKEILYSYGFAQGYFAENTIIPYSRKEVLFYRMNTHQLAPFVKHIGNFTMVIDVNYKLVWGEEKHLNIDTFSFLSQGIEKRKFLDKYEIYVLKRTYSLLYLCLHLFKEANSIYLLSIGDGATIRNYCDIYGLLKKSRFDYTSFLILSSMYKVEQYIKEILYETSIVFNDKTMLNTFDIDPKALPFWDCYGLCDAERKKWRLPFLTRLFKCNKFDYIISNLNESDVKKIELNKKYIGN